MTPQKTLAARVRESIAEKNLPMDLPVKTWVGCGRRKACDGCGELIQSPQVEYDIRMRDSHTFRLHAGCHGLWLAELIRLKVWQPEPPQRRVECRAS